MAKACRYSIECGIIAIYLQIVHDYILSPQRELAHDQEQSMTIDSTDESAASKVAMMSGTYTQVGNFYRPPYLYNIKYSSPMRYSLVAGKTIAAAAGGKGTGGTPILDFLRPMHADTVKAKLASVSRTTDDE